MAEITVAVNFILSNLYNKLPRRRVDLYGEALDHLFRNHFQRLLLEHSQRRELDACGEVEAEDDRDDTTAAGKATARAAIESVIPEDMLSQEEENRLTQSEEKLHLLGEGASCENDASEDLLKFEIFIGGEHTHALMFEAARESGMDVMELLTYLPPDLLLHVSPGLVSYQMGVTVDPHAQHCVIFNTAMSHSSEFTESSQPGSSGRLTRNSNWSASGNALVSSTMPHSSSSQLNHNVDHLSGQLRGLMLNAGGCGVGSSHSPCSLRIPSPNNMNQSTNWSSISPSPTNSQPPGFTMISMSTGGNVSLPGGGGGGGGGSRRHHQNQAYRQYPSYSSQIGPCGGVGGGGQPPHHGYGVMPPASNLLHSQYLQKSNSTPNFTAATFAQTKFGSTKLKSHNKQKLLVPGMSSQSGSGNCPLSGCSTQAHPTARLSPMDLPLHQMRQQTFSGGRGRSYHPMSSGPGHSAQLSPASSHFYTSMGPSTGTVSLGNLMQNRSLSLSPYAPLPLACEGLSEEPPDFMLNTYEDNEGMDSASSTGAAGLWSVQDDQPSLIGSASIFSGLQHHSWAMRRTSGPGGLLQPNPTFHFCGPDDEQERSTAHYNDYTGQITDTNTTSSCGGETHPSSTHSLAPDSSPVILSREELWRRASSPGNIQTAAFLLPHRSPPKCPISDIIQHFTEPAT